MISEERIEICLNLIIMTDVVCIFFKNVSNFNPFFISVWDIWDKGRQPQRATLKHGSIYDDYDILEEIGR